MIGRRLVKDFHDFHVWCFVIRQRCMGVRLTVRFALCSRPGGWWRASGHGRRQFPVERDQLGTQRAGEPKVASIIGGQTSQRGPA
jgi:hypothetical protein